MKQKWIGIFTVICILSYIGSIVLLGSLNDDYSHVQNLVSELGKPSMPYNFVLNITLVVSGVSLLTLAYYLNRILPKSKAQSIGTISLGLFGFSVIAGGLFPCEIDCMTPSTISGYLHAYLGMPTLITAPLSFIALGISMRATRQFNNLSELSIGLGILCFLALVASFTLFSQLNLTGLGQRIAAFFQLSVPFLISLHIINYHESTSV